MDFRYDIAMTGNESPFIFSPDYSSQNEDAKKAYLETKRYLEELESFDGLKSPQKFESSSPQVKRSLEFDSLSSPKKQSSVNGKHDFESRASPRKQVSISSTFYTCLFCTKVFCEAFL